MSTLKFNQWLNTDNTENYKCRAWVNFNGQGTVAIRGSGNVSSITDNGTGDYTVNFTTALADANYATVFVSTAIGGGSVRLGTFISRTALAVRFQGVDGSGVPTDWSENNVCILR